MVVKAESGPSFRWGVPKEVLSREGMGFFDVDPEGQFFIVSEVNPEARIEEIHVIVNWAETLASTVVEGQ